MINERPKSPPFPYTTLFRSRGRDALPARRRGRARDLRERARDPALRSSARVHRRRRSRRAHPPVARPRLEDRKSTRLNSSHVEISYAVFCLKKKTALLGATE